MPCCCVQDQLGILLYVINLVDPKDPSKGLSNGFKPYSLIYALHVRFMRNVKHHSSKLSAKVFDPFWSGGLERTDLDAFLGRCVGHACEEATNPTQPLCGNP